MHIYHEYDSAEEIIFGCDTKSSFAAETIRDMLVEAAT
jgi:hypothetical protein